MWADRLRNRTVGCKMTESEYEKLAGVTKREGMALRGWFLEGPLVLVETLAMRTFPAECATRAGR